MGDDLAASKLLAELVRANPLLSPEIRLHAAVVFAAIGQRSAAQTQLALALKLNPSLKGSEEAKQVQSRLSGVK